MQGSPAIVLCGIVELEHRPITPGGRVAAVSAATLPRTISR
jgi:hypothetical protein